MHSRADTINSSYGTKIYSGIGSRVCPPWHLSEMILLSKTLASKGYILRSGGAEGSDKAFESGCDWAKGAKEIYRPSDSNNRSEAILQEVINYLNITYKESIPDLRSMKKYVRGLLGRNMFQILGKDLATPSNFVICYTPGGNMVGGTRYALALAKMNNIPIYNLALLKPEEILERINNG